MALKLVTGMREDWKTLYNNLLGAEVTERRQALIFQLSMLVCEIRCARCLAVGSCNLFCFGKCNHISNKTMH